MKKKIKEYNTNKQIQIIKILLMNKNLFKMI